MKMIRILIYACTFALLTGCTAETDSPHPFEAYLSEPHPAYEYELHQTIEGDGYTGYVIRMVSQEWLTPEEVNETTWWHWLTIVVPDEVHHSTGMLWIGGGTNYSDAPETPNSAVLQAALATNSITAHLHNVPFQPISFLNDDRLDQRYEDDLIALGWRKYLEQGAQDEDAEWLARLPMTAAAMRAMDTISEFTETELNHSVETYLVAGASKRGWTTWTTGIFDDRVVAIAPLVIDLLNLTPSFQHHWQALGEWSPAIREYEDERIMDWQFSSEYKRMLELIDPYSYLDRLDMPKFIVNGASDEFFLPDSWQFYWDDLVGDKYLRYVPNAGHSLGDSDAATSVIAFYNHILTSAPVPQLEWSVTDSGYEIRLDPDQLPDELILWSAHNPDARDFRLYVIDRIWVAQTIEIPEDGHVQIELNSPENGFTAWFAEATFNAESSLPLKLTTGVKVTPDVYQNDEFTPVEALGTLSGE